jgi:Zn-dependent M28 family amino/carboxypeptidase
MAAGMTTTPLTVFCLISSVALGAPSKGASPAEKAAAQSITQDLLRSQIRFLASDLLEGRGTASRGDKLAEAYVATRFEGLGLKPGGPDGKWYQPVELVEVNGRPETLTFSGNGKSLELKLSTDFMAVDGRQSTKTAIEKAELVFVGYGIVAPEYRWDDYKGADLKGKILLMMNNDPEDDPNLFAGKTRLWYGRWDYKYESAAKTGAAGAIIIHTTHSAGYPWQVIQTSWAGSQFSLPQKGGDHLQLRGWSTDEASKRIVALGGKDLDALRAAAEKRDFTPVPLGVTLSTAFTSTIQRTQTENVIGILPGSDPKLSRQAVVYTAHHDHLGIKKDAKPGDDIIYNGAVDNASGVSAILAIAQAFKRMPKVPKRSIVFVAVSAEEQGLLGSEYLAEHPPFPPGQLAADINIDGVNIWGRTRDVAMIGLGKSSIDDVLRPLVAMQGRSLKPDTFPDRGYFYRSDQFSLAKVGVPAAYLKHGNDFINRPEGWGKKQQEQWEATRYHQPSDELTDDWDLSGAVEDVQLNFYLGYQLAQAPAMPEWKKGDEFERARKKAHAEVKAGGR